MNTWLFTLNPENDKNNKISKKNTYGESNPEQEIFIYIRYAEWIDEKLNRILSLAKNLDNIKNLNELIISHNEINDLILLIKKTIDPFIKSIITNLDKENADSEDNQTIYLIIKRANLILNHIRIFQIEFQSQNIESAMKLNNSLKTIFKNTLNALNNENYMIQEDVEK